VPELPRLLRAPGSGLAAARGRLAGENQGCACTRRLSALACLRTVAQVWPGRRNRAAHRGSVARLQWACAGSLLSAVYAGLRLGRMRGHRCACWAGVLVVSISVLHEAGGQRAYEGERQVAQLHPPAPLRFKTSPRVRSSRSLKRSEATKGACRQSLPFPLIRPPDQCGKPPLCAAAVLHNQAHPQAPAFALTHMSVRITDSAGPFAVHARAGSAACFLSRMKAAKHRSARKQTLGPARALRSMGACTVRGAHAHGSGEAFEEGRRL